MMFPPRFLTNPPRFSGHSANVYSLYIRFAPSGSKQNGSGFQPGEFKSQIKIPSGGVLGKKG